MSVFMQRLKQNLAVILASLALAGTVVNTVISFRVLEYRVSQYEVHVKELAIIVDDHVKATTMLSSTLDSHLRVSQQLDSITEMRFKRIEEGLNRIESKLDQLKGWKLTKP